MSHREYTIYHHKRNSDKFKSIFRSYFRIKVEMSDGKHLFEGFDLCFYSLKYNHSMEIA